MTGNHTRTVQRRAGLITGGIDHAVVALRHIDNNNSSFHCLPDCLYKPSGGRDELPAPKVFITIPFRPESKLMTYCRLRDAEKDPCTSHCGQVRNGYFSGASPHVRQNYLLAVTDAQPYLGKTRIIGTLERVEVSRNCALLSGLPRHR